MGIPGTCAVIWTGSLWPVTSARSSGDAVYWVMRLWGYPGVEVKSFAWRLGPQNVGFACNSALCRITQFSLSQRKRGGSFLSTLSLENE